MIIDQVECLLDIWASSGTPKEKFGSDVRKKQVSVVSYRVHYKKLTCGSYRSGEEDNIVRSHSHTEASHSKERLNRPAARYGHSLTEIRSEMVFLFGGVSKQREYFNDAWIFLLEANETSVVPIPVTGDVPCGRFGHSAHCTLDGKSVIIFGGSNNTEWYSDLYVVETASLLTLTVAVFLRIEMFTLPTVDRFLTRSSEGSRVSLPAPRLPSCPSARRSHTLTPVSSGKAVLFGGHAVTSMNDVWILNESSFSWKYLEACGDNPSNSLENTPAQRYCHTAVVYPTPTIQQCESPITETEQPRGLFVFGGFLFSTVGDSTLWELNLSSFVWRRVEIRSQIAPPAIFGHSASVLSNCMILFGGTTVLPGGRTLDDCYVFSFRKNEWQLFNSADPIRSPQQLVAPAAKNPSSPSDIVLSAGHDVMTLGRQLLPVFSLEHPLTQDPVRCGLSSGRRSHAAVRVSPGKVFIFGGWDGSHVDDDCFQLTVAPSTLQEWSYDFLSLSQKLRC